MGHALGLFLAHAVHIARLSANNRRLRAGPGGGAVLGAAGAAGDVAMLWAILQVPGSLIGPVLFAVMQHWKGSAEGRSAVMQCSAGIGGVHAHASGSSFRTEGVCLCCQWAFGVVLSLGSGRSHACCIVLCTDTFVALQGLVAKVAMPLPLGCADTQHGVCSTGRHALSFFPAAAQRLANAGTPPWAPGLADAGLQRTSGAR